MIYYGSFSEAVNRFKHYWTTFREAWPTYFFRMVVVALRNTDTFYPMHLSVRGQFKEETRAIRPHVIDPALLQFFEGTLTQGQFADFLEQLVTEKVISIPDIEKYDLLLVDSNAKFAPFEKVRSWEIPREEVDESRYGLLSWGNQSPLEVDLNRLGNLAILQGYDGFEQLLQVEVGASRYPDYRLLLPLPMRVSANYKEKDEVLQINTRCHDPVKLNEVQILIGARSSDAQSTKMGAESTSSNGWTSGYAQQKISNAEIGDTHVWVTHPLLTDRWSSETMSQDAVKLPVSVDKEPSVVGLDETCLEMIYVKPDSTNIAWNVLEQDMIGSQYDQKRDQKNSHQSSRFESAIVNALVAQGHRVYFGGKGVDTEAIDCVAMVQNSQDVLIISATTSLKTVGNKVQQLIEYRQRWKEAFSGVKVKWIVAVPQPRGQIPWTAMADAVKGEIYLCDKSVLTGLNNSLRQLQKEPLAWLEDANPSRMREQLRKDLELGEGWVAE